MIDSKDLKPINKFFPHIDTGETKLEGQAFGSFYPNVKTEKTMLEHIIRQNMILIAMFEKLIDIAIIASPPAPIKEKEKITVIKAKKKTSPASKKPKAKTRAIKKKAVKPKK